MIDVPGITFLIVLAAYFIRGITGAGSGLIAIPLLAQYLPLTTVVPLVLTLDFTASVVLSFYTKGLGEWEELKRLLPFSIVGVITGTLLLIKIPALYLLLGLSLFVVVFGVRNLINPVVAPISKHWAPVAGFCGGSIGALFGTGGPPYMIYLGSRLLDKSKLRATFSRLFLLEGAIRLITFAVAGLLLNEYILKLWLFTIPLVGLGLWLGSKVHLKTSNPQIQQLLGLLLVTNGILLFLKALAN